MDEQKILETEKIEEETIEVVNDEVEETCDCGCCECGGNEEVEKLEEVCNCENKNSFLKNLGIVLVDQVIVVAISLLCILLPNLIMYYGFGYFIKNEYLGSCLLVAYLIINLLYTTIMETKAGQTVGRKLIK